MKDIKKEFTYNDKKYSMVFNLNIMEDLQQKYGSLEAWLEKINVKKWEDIVMNALRYALTLMINEGIDIENENLPENERKQFLTERQVGRMISAELINRFNQTVGESTKIENLPKNE